MRLYMGKLCISLNRIQCCYDSFNTSQCNKYLILDLFHIDLLDERIEKLSIMYFSESSVQR